MVRITKENWYMLAVAAGLVVAATLLVYRRQSSRLEQLREQIATEKLAMEADSNKAAVVPDMLRSVMDMKRRYKDFDRRLPKSKELGGFLQEITAIRSQSDLQGGRMDTGNPVSEYLYNTMPIKMSFEGSYLALARFLEQISKMQRLTRVQKLLITAPGDGFGKDLGIELFMNIYFTKI